MNGGVCSTITDGHYFSCSCPSNYTGERCEVELADVCEDHPCPDNYCLNNGTCSLAPEDCSPRCACPEGTTGPRCETFDLCASNPCSGHSHSCVNTMSEGEVAFLCDCIEGWGGAACEYDLDECQSSPCNGGACVNVPGSFRCDCPGGTTGPQCEHLLQCSDELCGVGGDCVVPASENGTVRCDCRPGYTGALCETEGQCIK